MEASHDHGSLVVREIEACTCSTCKREPIRDRVANAAAAGPIDSIMVAGRRVRPAKVFDTYWRFAAERQQVYQARLRGEPGPWTADSIIASHRFTNCYRAADRVSQYLINEVIYRGSQDADEVLFRILLFRFFNRISTWRLLHSALGELTWAAFRLDRYDEVLSEAFSRGERIYSAAYVVPPPKLGAQRKHTNHLLLLQQMLRGGLRNKLQSMRVDGGGVPPAARLSRDGRLPGLSISHRHQLLHSDQLR